MRLTLEKQIPLAFAIVLISLLMLGFFAYGGTTKLNEALRWEKHTQEVLLQLDDTLRFTVDAETGTRGFIITGNDSFLDPYNSAVQNIGGSLAHLRELISDNPHQSERFGRLDDLINQKFAVMKKFVEMRRAQSLAAVAAEADKGRGKILMTEIRALVGEMKNEETELLKTREADLETSLNDIYRLLFVGTLVGIVSIGFANFAIFRETRKRSRAEESLIDANHNLEKRVETRTLELARSNDELKHEAEKREQSDSILRASQNRLALALEAGRAGSFEWDLKNNFVRWSPELEKMYGVAVGTFEGDFQSWLKRIEPEDAESVEAGVRAAIAEKLERYNYEFRVILPDGARRWLAGRALFEYDGGEPARMIGINVDINEIKQAEAEREELLRRERAARKDAEISNRLRDEFLATVSHELRAPLNSILGWARLMQQGKLDETTAHKAVETIVRNADAQNRLIEDLLDVSRIISGKLRLEVMTVRPTNVVESALETVRPAAEAKNIKLEVREDAEVSHISGDPNRLQQVIWNLLSNAIKFTPNDGQVRVEIERSDSNVEIRVRDTGVGIRQEFLPHVFDRFSQADTSSIRKFGGLGLGLAIVRHLTEMHGGTVYAESAGENKGSTFIVKLPLAVSPPEESKTDSPDEAKPNDFQTAHLSLDGLLILVVDDEEDTRQLLVQSLTNYGATVIAASSAQAALDAIQTQNPDVLVSDIGMPDEDGYSLIRRVRALENDVPAIALTAFTRAQDRMRALGAGFQNHVSKPVEPDELATVIASLTGRLQMSVEE